MTPKETPSVSRLSDGSIRDKQASELENEKLKYPKSVFFIVTNEFCERFSYYGMRTILALYLKNKLDYSDNTATVIYHIFTMFVYFFPLLGAMLADSVLGKFRTIFYLSIVYALGQNNQSILMEPFALWEDHNVKITGNQSIPYFANFSECGGTEEANGFITAVEKQATSYVIEPSFPYAYKDHINKSESGNPAIRVLSYNTLQPDAVTEVELSGTHHVFQTKRTKFHATQITPLKEFSPGKYSIKVNGKDAGRIDIKIGGVYTLQTYVTLDSVKISLVTVTPSNSVHILWLLPQYITIALAEVMFCVTGLEFAFKQAPSSMKSFLQASWLFTVAFGNVIVVIIAEAKFFEQQVSEFFFFAGLTALDFLLFAMLTRSYKYHNGTDYDEPPTSDEKNIPLVSLEKQQEQLKNSPVDEETAQLWEFTHEIAY
ncbi:peptide transporter family 1-like [Fopius arisanus]|uniref:Peptide transporter family 1-like n=1 Tax=Fopius arisanus TaxID=64838 RepID=A0A9R1TBH3_9HYME|nr:PREDICTED: peptide transporter family 1-like [Fopius arisanus]